MSASRQKGTRAESALVAYLRTRGFVYAERRALNGSRDRGDVAGIPGVVLEVKSAARVELAQWVKEAEAEAGHDGAGVFFVVAKRSGKGDPAQWYAITTVDVMCGLLGDDEGGVADAPPLVGKVGEMEMRS